MSTMTGFAPMALQTRRPIALSMQQLWLTGRVLAMGARLWVRHEFVSQESKALEVIYSFALPRDAALRRFRVTGADFHANSELRPTREAMEIYEAAIAAGSLSTLVRQYGDGMINLNVGNIRPREKVTVLLEMLAGVELRDDSLRLRFPFTLAPSYHRQAHGIEIAPGRFEMELPGEEFDELILPQFATNAKDLHQVGFCLDFEMTGMIEEISSPSHAVRVQTMTAEKSRVSLSRESDVPNRDLVLDVKCKAAGARVFGGVDTCGRGRFAAVIPSTEFGKLEKSARRVVILLDRSGSMEGTPIAQAKKAIGACLGALDAEDQFGIVAFSNNAEAFQPELCAGTMKEREKGRKFLEGITANGGTELAQGVEAAAKLLGNEPGDIFIITDGQVFGTEAILVRARATGVRIHCLGIGSASQDRFLGQLASHTGGTGRFLTPNERVDLPVLELFVSVGRPVTKQLVVKVEGGEGRVSPDPSSYVFSGSPLLVFGECAATGDMRLRITWDAVREGAQLDLAIPAKDLTLGPTLKLLQGSRILSDLESRIPRVFGPGVGAGVRKEAERARERLAELSREYQLASSAMSLVSVVKRTGDVANEIPKTMIVATGLMEEISLDAGHRALCVGQSPLLLASLSKPGSSPPSATISSLQGTIKKKIGMRFYSTGKTEADWAPATEAMSTEDMLVALAGMLQPDGGMPGKTAEVRVAKSLTALLCFASEGHASGTGAFRMHVAKLVQFLNAELLKQLDGGKAEEVRRVLKAIAKGRMPKGDWLESGKRLVEQDTLDLDVFWERVREAA